MDRLVFKVYIVVYAILLIILVGSITAIWISAGWKAGLACIAGLSIGIFLLFLLKKLWNVIDSLLDKLYDKYVA